MIISIEECLLSVFSRTTLRNTDTDYKRYMESKAYEEGRKQKQRRNDEKIISTTARVIQSMLWERPGQCRHFFLMDDFDHQNKYNVPSILYRWKGLERLPWWLLLYVIPFENWLYLQNNNNKSVGQIRHTSRMSSKEWPILCMFICRTRTVKVSFFDAKDSFTVRHFWNSHWWHSSKNVGENCQFVLQRHLQSDRKFHTSGADFAHTTIFTIVDSIHMKISLKCEKKPRIRVLRPFFIKNHSQVYVFFNIREYNMTDIETKLFRWQQPIKAHLTMATAYD